MMTKLERGDEMMNGTATSNNEGESPADTTEETTAKINAPSTHPLQHDIDHSENNLFTSWSQEDKTALLNSIDGQQEEVSGPKFQPGDHVIRWQLLKFMVWPIQIHGIVLNVEDVIGECNKSGEDDGLDAFQRQQPRYKITIADFGYTSSQQQQQPQQRRGENKNFAQRFNSMNQNVNDMMKSFYRTKQTNDNPETALDIDGSYFDRLPTHSPTTSPTNDSSTATTTASDASEQTTSETPIESKRSFHQDPHFRFDGNGTEERRKRFQVIEISDPNVLKKWHKIDYGKSLFKKGNKFKETVAKSGRTLAKSGRTLMGKLNLDKLNLGDKLNFRKNNKDRRNYSSIAMDQNDSKISSAPTSIQDDTPKLPKSDPRKIVLARTIYILDQQDLPESEQTLPPYHILYSNSECLAVWCKTGKFSTLQAAVFLHSTAVGNAKSTFLMTGAVVATQPWLIPLVGIYGAVGIGMPYLILKKCKENWSKSELKLTDGFWSSADPEVYVTAVQCWSNIIDSTKNNTDDSADYDAKRLSSQSDEMFV